MTWINIWRPSKNAKDDYGQPYKENEVLLVVEKAKPKGVSFKGQTSLFFDFQKNRYYEDINFGQYYAFKHEEISKQILESSSFAMPESKIISINTIPEDEIPF